MRTKKLLATLSTITGNTEKISEAVRCALTKEGFIIDVYKNSEIDKPAPSKDGKSDQDDFGSPILVFFWCRRSGLDDLSKSFIKKNKNREFLAFGTMGAYPYGEYGNKVKKNVTEFIEASGNRCLGVFLSQGAIPVEKTIYRASLPKDNPHHLDEAGVARHEESRLHPNEADLHAAVKFATDVLL